MTFMAPPEIKRNLLQAEISKRPANWLLHLESLNGAYSENTIRAYRSDFQAFESWCSKHNQIALPAISETIVTFIESNSLQLSTSTITRRLSGISKLHLLIGHKDPTVSEDVKLALRRVYRKKGRRKKQALGLTRNLLNALLATCEDDDIGLRDKLILSMGYDTLCRRSELVQLCFEDITQQTDQSATILVHSAKNDQFGEGRLAYLSQDTMSQIEYWKAVARKSSGLILCRSGRPVRSRLSLHPSTINRIIKRRARLAELPDQTIQKLSGHSMRVGAAQDMAAAGIDLVSIMHAGGWKSPTIVMRYVEHLDVLKSGMAQLNQKRINQSYAFGSSFGSN